MQMQVNKKIMVIGCGAWGTTLAKVLAENKHDVELYCHESDVSDDINATHSNSKYLAQVDLPTNLVATMSLEGLRSADVCLLVVPSKFYRAEVKKVLPYLKSGAILASATKGLEEGSNKTIIEILQDECESQRYQDIVLVSGPNLAKEIADKKLAAIVIASKNTQHAEDFQKLITNQYLRAYTTDDILGVELGGTLKNVIAIAAGVIDGLGLGDNAKSALMVRGIVEISDLATKMGAKQETLYGLTGLGDLITTCSSPKSRNNTLGRRLAKGESLADILSSTVAVAEGVKTAKVVKQLAQKFGVEMPISETVYAILFENKSIKTSIDQLMKRSLKAEFS
jgi:glycerol-3-phosphate dehydrogenase (NAD(P)+)